MIVQLLDCQRWTLDARGRPLTRPIGGSRLRVRGMGCNVDRRGSVVVHVSLDRRQHPYRGTIALRHETNDFTMRLGHIGYGIRPSARRQVSLSC